MQAEKKYRKWLGMLKIFYGCMSPHFARHYLAEKVEDHFRAAVTKLGQLFFDHKSMVDS
jgi:hypothetical protein